MSGYAPSAASSGGRGAGSAVALSRQLNQQITQAANLQVRRRGPPPLDRPELPAAALPPPPPPPAVLDPRCTLAFPPPQELVHTVVVNFNRMNAVNYCTAYHRIAKHVQARPA